MANGQFLKALLGLTFSMTSLQAATINFDDIDASAGDVILSNYQGYTWVNFSAYTDVPGFPGFNAGIVSSPNAAYGGGEILGNAVLGEITATSPFNFTSAYLGSGYYDNLSLTVQGLFGGVSHFSQTVTVSTEGAQLFNFSFTGIDELVFSGAQTAATTDPYSCGPVNCTFFTIDDAVLTPSSAPPGTPNAPEPSTSICCVLGILAMFPLRRYRPQP
jgi:hypothetical protein